MIIMNLKDRSDTKRLIALGGFTLRGFADSISISHAYLSQILSEKRTPSPTIAQKIAGGLNKNIDDIFLIKVFDVNDQ